MLAKQTTHRVHPSWAAHGPESVVMAKLKKPVIFETTFGVDVVDELLGEGGAWSHLWRYGPRRNTCRAECSCIRTRIGRQEAPIQERGLFPCAQQTS